MRIPYAKSDFAAIRTERCFYVDKTPYIPQLEAVEGDHLIFLRPRRFGKSTLISTLTHYYDINNGHRFDELFGGLWIHQNPTPLKNKYLVLKLDFSPIDTDGTIAQIRKSFATQVKAPVSNFIHRYATLVPSLLEVLPLLKSPDEDTAALMTELLTHVERAGHQVYLFIDEYDHFGNRLLADGKKSTYDEIVKASGFARGFYASLKAFTTTSTLARTFVTGVAPVMLDDLSSGFNIITHISQGTAFNGLAGFTRTDVERALDVMLHDRPDLSNDPRIGDRQALLAILERYYNGYRFSKRAKEKLYNSTLVLYFLRELLAEGVYPEQMLDLNARTDYGRLYQIAAYSSGKDTDTRELLEEILTKESVTVPLVEQFGTKRYLGRPQIASLFYYMGMLTFAEDAADERDAKLVIPNRVMRELQWEYLSFALAEHDSIQFDTGDMANALSKMASNGDIQPLIDLFHREVVGRMGLRETLRFDEQTMKLMLFAYLSQSNAFFLATEKEVKQGYCDLLLGLRHRNLSSRYAWIIEAKYVKSDATELAIESMTKQGFSQIEQYMSDADLVAMLAQGNQMKAGVLVFVGLKDVRYRAWEPGPRTFT